jgi:hypothetical protein
MRNRIRFIAIALASSVVATNQTLLWNIPISQAKEIPLSANHAVKQEQNSLVDNRNKGIFDQILNGIGGQVTKTVLAKQLREMGQNNAPVTISTDNLYEAVGNLPGNTPFRPLMLNLSQIGSKSALPVGDYLIPVRVYCMQKSGSSPNGHRYVLGKYGGKRRKVVAALNAAAVSSRYSHQEIQGTSWAVQSGMRYADMPSDMKAIVDTLIPEYRDDINKKDFLVQVQEVWSVAGPALNLGSLESFLQNKVGEPGKIILWALAMRQGVVQSGADWRNLGNTFILPDSGTRRQDIENTPWSQVQEGVYARFVTPKNYSGVGLFEVRIASDGSLQVPVQRETKQAKPNDAVPMSNITVQQLQDIIRQSVAVPEGKDNVQPLSIEPTTPDDWWQDWKDLWRQLGDSLPTLPNEFRNALSKAAVAGSLPAACAVLARAGAVRAAAIPVLIKTGVATGGTGLLVAASLYGACGLLGVATAQSLPTLNNESTEDMGNGNGGSVSQGNRKIKFDQRQLQEKFSQHARAFGINENWNKTSAQKFIDALRKHIQNPVTKKIEGTYRKNLEVIHYINPENKLLVMTDRNGNFISGFRLNPDQLKNVLTRGQL